MSSSEHTLNTLRYTSRVKELPLKGSSNKIEDAIDDDIFANQEANQEHFQPPVDARQNPITSPAAHSNANENNPITVSDDEKIERDYSNEIQAMSHDVKQLVASAVCSLNKAGNFMESMLASKISQNTDADFAKKQQMLKIFKKYTSEVNKSEKTISDAIDKIINS